MRPLPGGTFHKLFTAAEPFARRTCQRLRTAFWTLKKKGYETVKFNMPERGILA
jgi:hypothetical protein